MITIGLTGSIGMGKSTVAAMFADLGAPVWDADRAVHRLYAPGGGAVGPIGEQFPSVVRDHGDGAFVDREALSAIVLGDAEKLRALEAIVHPLVAMDRLAFGDKAIEEGVAAAVFDVPLLFENGSQSFFDVVVVVSAPEDIQRARVLDRPGMTSEKFQSIVDKQTPDAEKRAQADYVIDTGVDMAETRAQVASVWRHITMSQKTRQ
ncbi:MAG: dephospho-CoA kinase [Pseudomonadota bacterium]